jgi:hypothetical protein
MNQVQAAKVHPFATIFCISRHKLYKLCERGPTSAAWLSCPLDTFMVMQLQLLKFASCKCLVLQSPASKLLFAYLFVSQLATVPSARLCILDALQYGIIVLS